MAAEESTSVCQGSVIVDANDVVETVWLSVDLDAPLAACWQALVDAEKLSVWFTACTTANRSAHFIFDDGVEPYTKTFVVDSCVVLRKLHGVLHDPGYPDSEIDISLLQTRQPEPDDASRTTTAILVTLTLMHRRVPHSLLEGYRRGWPSYIARLKEYVES